MASDREPCGGQGWVDAQRMMPKPSISDDLQSPSPGGLHLPACLPTSTGNTMKLEELAVGLLCGKRGVDEQGK